MGKYGESEAILVLILWGLEVHFGSILGGGRRPFFAYSWAKVLLGLYCRLCYTSGTILRGQRPLHPGWLPEDGILNFFESLSKSLILV